MLSHSEIHDRELERIRTEYARREREVPEEYYSIHSEGNLFLYTQRIRAVIQVLNQKNFFPLRGKKILEVGFGKGNWLLDFERWGASQGDLYGIELNERRAAHAQMRFPLSELRVGDASRLPWPNETFDLVLQSTVFSSILSTPMKQSVAREMIRVLEPHGVILWYDFHCDNPKNPHVRGIGAREIKELFSPCVVNLRRVTLAPPISRWLAPRSWLLSHLLERIRILNTHYLAVIEKRS